MKNSNLDLHTVILAGGLGTRLKPVSAAIPKCLIPINDRPFLYYLLDQLVAQGIRRVTLCSGIHSETFQQIFTNHPYPHLDITFAAESTPLGTGGALKSACYPIKEKKILVMNGDTYLHFDLQALAKFHQEKKAQVSMVVAMTSATESGIVTINQQSEVLDFRRAENASTALVNCGVYVMERDFFIKHTENLSVFSLENDFLEKLGTNQLYAFINSSNFFDIGTPERLEIFKTRQPYSNE